MSQELADARQRVTDLEADQRRFRIPADVAPGTVIPHDYGSAVRYALVVETEPEVKVVWFSGNAETIDHLDPVDERVTATDETVTNPGAV